jgi:hypothetical protein
VCSIAVYLCSYECDFGVLFEVRVSVSVNEKVASVVRLSAVDTVRHRVCNACNVFVMSFVVVMWSW